MQRSKNESLQAIVKAYAKTTAGNMVNLSAIGASHLGMLDEYGKFKPLEKFCTEAIDKAVMFFLNVNAQRELKHTKANTTKYLILQA